MRKSKKLLVLIATTLIFGKIRCSEKLSLDELKVIKTAWVNATNRTELNSEVAAAPHPINLNSGEKLWHQRYSYFRHGDIVYRFDGDTLCVTKYDAFSNSPEAHGIDPSKSNLWEQKESLYLLGIAEMYPKKKILSTLSDESHSSKIRQRGRYALWNTEWQEKLRREEQMFTTPSGIKPEKLHNDWQIAERKSIEKKLTFDHMLPNQMACIKINNKFCNCYCTQGSSHDKKIFYKKHDDTWQKTPEVTKYSDIQKPGFKWTKSNELKNWWEIFKNIEATREEVDCRNKIGPEQRSFIDKCAYYCTTEKPDGSPEKRVFYKFDGWKLWKAEKNPTADPRLCDVEKANWLETDVSHRHLKEENFLYLPNSYTSDDPYKYFAKRPPQKDPATKHSSQNTKTKPPTPWHKTAFGMMGIGAGVSATTFCVALFSAMHENKKLRKQEKTNEETCINKKKQNLAKKAWIRLKQQKLLLIPFVTGLSIVALGGVFKGLEHFEFETG
ncbi:hypothetical protein KAU11_02480 [Candidatus Babeliales bacterium]|nr:hypothetical protein [Candidatus Babeliales bacterium]